MKTDTDALDYPECHNLLCSVSNILGCHSVLVLSAWCIGVFFPQVMRDIFQAARLQVQV
jgi:hypothetical protein